MTGDNKHNFSCVVLAAGKGTRMRSTLPKVMHKLAGKPMVTHVLASLKPLALKDAVVVVAPEMEAVQEVCSQELAHCRFAVQGEQLGTGHAVKCGIEKLPEGDGVVLVLYGDTPMISTKTINRMLTEHTKQGVAISMLAMNLDNPTGYGRLLMDPEPYVQRIVEEKDASPTERRVHWGWGGVMAFDAAFLREALEKLEPSSVTGEYYLTLLPEMATAQGRKNLMIEISPTEVMGINNKIQLAEAEKIMQDKLRREAMEQGVTMIDPNSVYLQPDTKLASDVVIHPNVVFGADVTVETGVEIRSFCHIEGARIKKGAVIGPFARLRPGASIGEEARVGNFVEIKKSTLGKGAKVNHLSYVGDSEVGAGANIGAGTITCNYDGVNKYKTTIGAGAFIGSNTALVAPVKVGDNAIVAAGSVITEEVPADALAIARPAQVNKEAKAKEIRQKQKKTG